MPAPKRLRSVVLRREGGGRAHLASGRRLLASRLPLSRSRIRVARGDAQAERWPFYPPFFFDSGIKPIPACCCALLHVVTRCCPASSSNRRAGFRGVFSGDDVIHWSAFVSVETWRVSGEGSVLVQGCIMRTFGPLFVLMPCGGRREIARDGTGRALCHWQLKTWSRRASGIQSRESHTPRRIAG